MPCFLRKEEEEEKKMTVERAVANYRNFFSWDLSHRGDWREDGGAVISCQAFRQLQKAFRNSVMGRYSVVGKFVTSHVL